MQRVSPSPVEIKLLNYAIDFFIWDSVGAAAAAGTCHFIPICSIELLASKHSAMSGGRVFRAFTLVDDCTREPLAIEVDFSLSADRVVRTLERVIAQRGQPQAIVCDNGPEFTSRTMLSWAHHRGITLAFIRPGKPIENAFVESCNGRLRDECLNLHWFLTIADARYRIEAFRVSFITARPHSGLGGLTPQQFSQKLKKEKQDEELTRLSA